VSIDIDDGDVTTFDDATPVDTDTWQCIQRMIAPEAPGDDILCTFGDGATMIFGIRDTDIRDRNSIVAISIQIDDDVTAGVA